MWSPASTDIAACAAGSPDGLLLQARGLAAAAVLVLLGACSSAPTKPSGPSLQSPAPRPSAAAEQSSAIQAAGQPGAVAPPPVVIPERVRSDFDRAVGFMRAGNATEAELEFKQIALQAPQLAVPYVNLGILYRRSGRLDQAEQALKTAVEHNTGSAVAWTELGATQRLRGQFQDAAASYEHAIAADPNFAPAYRNLGVVSDLYLGDPERALLALEKYKQLTGEDKPVSGWIAELRQRTGKPPATKPSPAAQPPAAQPPADGAPSETSPGPPAEPAASPAAPPSKVGG